MRNWLLPEYLEDVLPSEARQIEALRAKLLALYRVHGYELVIPPLLEYLESLLTGTGEDLDLRTFKLVDQMSGRMMGIRADITPQVARIDAHLLNRHGVTRLCYSGNVLHTQPRSVRGTREPFQIGAEIYGHAGIESDLEIQDLMRKSLHACGVGPFRVDIGHVGIFRALCKRAGLDRQREMDIHECLQSKDNSSLPDLLRNLPQATADALKMLPQLYGDKSILSAAKSALPRLPEIESALSDMAALIEYDKDIDVSIDFADLRGYHYHSGVVFTAYVDGEAGPVAVGGRYDEVGKAFGRARPATGFSMDLRDLARLGRTPQKERGAILAPYKPDDQSLLQAIEKLRANEEIVIVDFPGHASSLDELSCDRKLVLRGRAWEVQKP